MITKFALRMMLLAMPLLLLAACSDDPVDPVPGAQFTTNFIYSSEYLRNRFFKLDLPEKEVQGRAGKEVIDLVSIRVFQKMGPGTPTPEDITNVAAYVDSNGWRDWDTIDFTRPFAYGSRWRRITDFSAYFDPNENLLAIDFGRDLGNETILAVTYDILDAMGGQLVGRVGDNAEIAPQSQPLESDPGNLYYRMKLLKTTAYQPDPHVFEYVLRNIYSLGSSNIDPSGFDFRIEENNQANDRPDRDEQGYDYFRIFGLDNENLQGEPGADGVVDYHDALIFDFRKGYLKFPLDFPQPFAAAPAQYEANVQSDDWVWDEASSLARNLTPQIYDPDIPPHDYYQYQKFKIVVTTRDCPP